eukprot:9453243-Heterocapsa_arctica.AAC.1
MADLSLNGLSGDAAIFAFPGSHALLRRPCLLWTRAPSFLHPFWLIRFPYHQAIYMDSDDLSLISTNIGNNSTCWQLTW